MEKPKKRKKLALGRGLDALIPDIASIADPSAPDKKYFKCNIDLISPNRHQPRRRFAEDELNDLSKSISRQGILQPLLVRKSDSGYELIAGERRLRAAKMAGLDQVPVIVYAASDEKMLELSIVENLQREDLNAMEAANAFHHLITAFALTQDQVAERLGKSRSAIANTLRLRQLPQSIKSAIQEGTLSEGHARALLGAKNSAQQEAIFKTIVSKKLSVRETEALIRRLKAEKPKPQTPKPGSAEVYFSDLAMDLSRCLGTRVLIKRQGKKGKLEIEFYSNDDLDRLTHLLTSVDP